MEDTYRKQVELLIRCLPEVEKQACFALKGGTAINLFVRNMPRLSVDIDLTYLPIEPRDETLIHIEEALARISEDIQKSVADSIVAPVVDNHHIDKLIIQHKGARIKIEPNIVHRGAIFEIETHELCSRAEQEYEVSATANTIATPELYGSKITAALDRQHPRDLFDITLLLAHEGLTDEIRKAFVVYLASHNRPMSELLDPIYKDIEALYETQFRGMVRDPVDLGDLIKTREILVKKVKNELTDNERSFLISIKSGEADFELLDIQDIERLPGLQWKIQNVRRMNESRRSASLEKLKRVLGI